MNKVQTLELRCLLIGLGSLVGGVSCLISKRRRLATWPNTEATVDIVYTNKDGNQMLSVLFKDANNHSCRAEVKVIDAQNLGLGSVVSVAYDPVNSESAFLSDGWQIGLGVGAAIILGLILTSLSVWLYLNN